MTGDASAQARESSSSTASGSGSSTAGVERYDELLETLALLEEEALRKVESGRVYDPENERVRIKWIRIAKDVIAERRKVLADRDLTELTERLEELEEREGIDR